MSGPLDDFLGRVARLVLRSSTGKTGDSEAKSIVVTEAQLHEKGRSGDDFWLAFYLGGTGYPRLAVEEQAWIEADPVHSYYVVQYERCGESLKILRAQRAR